MDDLRSILQEAYDLVIHDSREEGAPVRLYTDSGLYYAFVCPAAYRFKKPLLDKVKRHVKNKGDWHLLPLVKTRNNERFVFQENKMAFLQPGVREIQPSPADLGRTLAEFHQATADLSGDKLFKPYTSTGSWRSMWKKRIRALEEYRDMLEDSRVITPFDQVVLTLFSYVHHLGQTALHYLTFAEYDKVWKETHTQGKVAYQNFEDGYFLFDDRGRRYLAGEYNWVLDIRVRDVGQWLKGKLRTTGWNPDEFFSFLDGYNQVAPLTENEYRLVYALVMYPGRLLRQVEEYGRLPEEERSRLDVVDWQEHCEREFEQMELFLRDYPPLMQEHYGVFVKGLDWPWRKQNEQTICVYH